jgi:XTP/dITP diphosphohydrolase
MRFKQRIELVKDKVLKAFSEIRHPVFVDHTGLYLNLLNGFPGGLTEIFWNRLKNKGIADLIGKSRDPGVTAVTLIGYCNGRNLEVFRGEVKGVIAPEPRGPEEFQWDAIFIPNKSTALSQTLPERLIEQTTPWSAISFWNCSLVY